MQKKDWLKKLSYQRSIEKSKVPFSKQIIICLLVNLSLITLLALSILILPPQIPLLYGLPEGEEQLVNSWAITIPNSLAFLIMFINSLLATQIKDEYLKMVVVLSGFVATFFATITVLKIFFLVGNI